MAASEASTDNTNGLLKSGKARMGAEVNFLLRRLKASVCSGFHWNLIFFLRRFNKGAQILL